MRSLQRLLMGVTSNSDHSALAATWSNACEVMLCARHLGDNLVLVPVGDDDAPAPFRPLPRALRGKRVFALTAFDPPGVTRTLEQNTAKNGELYACLRELQPEPEAVWPTWGYNLDEGWREDGFSLMYAEETYELALAAVTQIARRFDQGAIFDYAWGDGVDALRTTVPVTCNGEAHDVVRMRRVARVPVDASPMLRRPWAGPAVLQPNDD